MDKDTELLLLIYAAKGAGYRGNLAYMLGCVSAQLQELKEHREKHPDHFSQLPEHLR